MEIKEKLNLDQNGSLVDATKYRSMIGALMYLMSTRPEIVHATCLCARFLDADYARCKDTFKSTSDGAQFLGEKLVSSKPVFIRLLCPSHLDADTVNEIWLSLQQDSNLL
ncbi:hypothetical protein Tco_0323259 [Tanacetum coccineum]